MPDGRHRIETIFAFCTDGDELSAADADDLSLDVRGPFAGDLGDPADNLALRAANALREHAGTDRGARLTLTKSLPVASGIGGGSADAAAALRLLTRLWSIDPAHASAVAPGLGADVPACLLSMSVRGDGAGDELVPVSAGVSGTPVLLVNPRVELKTADVFAAWNGEDKGPLGDWRAGRNDLQAAAIEQVPLVGTVLAWLSVQNGVSFARMSGSGATCFALFESEDARDHAEIAVPREWWRLATYLR
ncbi:4-(cytidine 5'-diphospho)-2-C-methyl-D-erythritol kinase [Sphingomonas daechungensis]|uniref:4-(cytidine 5'-diphospho)-2-C-methyl-D-erythritol kinase n=1 Tax=Sphingomonas daechungensis TaxID=1176646 RepID=UPI00378314DE